MCESCSDSKPVLQPCVDGRSYQRIRMEGLENQAKKILEQPNCCLSSASEVLEYLSSLLNDCVPIHLLNLYPTPSHCVFSLNSLSSVGVYLLSLISFQWSECPLWAWEVATSTCERWNEMESFMSGVFKWRWEAIKDVGLMHILPGWKHELLN